MTPRRRMSAHLTLALFCALVSATAQAWQREQDSAVFRPDATVYARRANVKSASILDLTTESPPATASSTSVTDTSEAFRTAGNTGRDKNQQKGGRFQMQDVQQASIIGVGAQKDKRLVYSVLGLNSVDQRLADNARQYNIEPPDRAICVGSGYIVESVNTVLRVRDAETGKTLTDPVALNPFFGYAPQLIRNADGTFIQGPYITDPTCLYDADTKRFFLTITASPVNASTGDLLGPFSIDIAVSKTSDPRGEWWIYRLPAQNDGTGGTPNHHVPGGQAISDFPHTGTDANGFYITTDEFALFADVFWGVNWYALDKFALAAGKSRVAATNFFIRANKFPLPFAVVPVKLPGDAKQSNHNKTYFVSTKQSTPNGQNNTEIFNTISLWTMSNTNSLQQGSPTEQLRLRVDNLKTHNFGNILDLVPQKNGTNPYGLSLVPPQPVGPLNAEDSRVINAFYADGRVWGAFETQGFMRGQLTTGMVVFAINSERRQFDLLREVASPGQHFLYPTVAINSAGEGAVTFTLTSRKYWPTAAYAHVNINNIGPVRIAALGRAPQDGFSEYRRPGDTVYRPRWGDYGDGAVDESGNIYLGVEYIAAPACSFREFNSTTSITRCGGTRTRVTNWATSLTKLRPASSRNDRSQ